MAPLWSVVAGILDDPRMHRNVKPSAAHGMQAKRGQTIVSTHLGFFSLAFRQRCDLALRCFQLPACRRHKVFEPLICAIKAQPTPFRGGEAVGGVVQSICRLKAAFLGRLLQAAVAAGAAVAAVPMGGRGEMQKAE